VATIDIALNRYTINLKNHRPLGTTVSTGHIGHLTR